VRVCVCVCIYVYIYICLCEYLPCIHVHTYKPYTCIHISHTCVYMYGIHTCATARILAIHVYIYMLYVLAIHVYIYMLYVLAIHVYIYMLYVHMYTYNI